MPNFSACFGAAFLTLHPTRYADLLQQKLDKHDCTAYLVNTGWSGGPYGVGQRMSIATTRACIDAILDGSIHQTQFTQYPIFGFDIPKTLPNVDPTLLNPRNAWADKNAYDDAAKNLAGMFVKNFEQYAGKGSVDYTQYGPKL